jgi:hypothetical protein
MRTKTPMPTERAVVYRSRRRQWLIAAGMVALFLLLWSQTQQPDYETHIRPAFSRYIWELAPFVLLTVVMAVRAFRVRTVTGDDGVHLARVLTNEFHPWSEITGIEVHPTPSGKLVAVKLRLRDRRTVKVSTFRRRRRDGGRSPEADDLARRLAADRAARAEGLMPEPMPPVGSASGRGLATGTAGGS